MIRTYLLALALLGPAAPAFAHAFLQRATPPVGSVVPASPPEISLSFSEGVEPLFSTIEVRNASGAIVSAGKPHVAPGDDRRLVLDLPKLPPGSYSVIWHVTSVDTHKTEGNYKFTISP
jgi:methionine-rich copper-binding protein CopC